MDTSVDNLSGGRRPVDECHPLIADQPVLRSWLVAGVLLLLSVASVLILDHRCSGYLKTHRLSGEFMNLFQAMEHFGTPYGATLILITVWITAPRVRVRIVRTFSAAVAAGLVANIVKLCVTRTRPKAFDFDYPVWSSFTNVFQWGAGGSAQQGFPSAHTAFAFGFAVLLGELFPVARRWFLCLGALVAMQRVVTCAHFPSDVLVGAAIGYVTGRYYAGSTAISRICDIVEGRLSPGEATPTALVTITPLVRIESHSPASSFANSSTTL